MDGPSETTVAAIRQHLAEIEAAEGVRVLYAAESGSRAWGFASPDSDYDIRFLYRHSADWYLSLTEPRDVIERPLTPERFDLAGWDLRKALRLFLHSNPPLHEWLVSPVVYIDRDGLAERLRARAHTTYSRHAVGMHYLGTVKRNRRDHFLRPGPVREKRYFYSLRPLCTLLWLLDRDGLPPMDRPTLLDGVRVADAVRAEMARLIAAKREDPEKREGPRNAVLDDWIDQVIARGERECRILLRTAPAGAAVEALYRDLVRAAPDA